MSQFGTKKQIFGCDYLRLNKLNVCRHCLRFLSYRQNSTIKWFIISQQYNKCYIIAFIRDVSDAVVFFLGKIRFYTFYRSANLLDSNCELLFYYQAILPHGPYKNVNKGHF